MNNEKEVNLLDDLWSEAELKRDNYKIWKKIYYWLDCDNLGDIILDRGVFWFEKTCSTAHFPNYIYNYLINWGEKKGYTFLYHLSGGKL